MSQTHAGGAVACAMLAIAALAQAPPAGGRSQISGTVTSVNTAAPQLSLKSDEGAAVSVTITDRTVIRRSRRQPLSPPPAKARVPRSMAAGCAT